MNAVENAYLAWASWHETDEDSDRLAKTLEIKAPPFQKRILFALHVPVGKFVSFHEAGCKAIALTQDFGTGFPNVPFACKNCGQEVRSLDELTFDIQVWGESA